LGKQPISQSLIPLAGIEVATFRVVGAGT
jgi:hypothetical protein